MYFTSSFLSSVFTQHHSHKQQSSVSPLFLSHAAVTDDSPVRTPAAWEQLDYNPSNYRYSTYNYTILDSCPSADPRPCGDFPWPDAAVEAVNCDYDYQHYSYPDVKGRCNVKCSDEDDLLVGPPYFNYHLPWYDLSGTYVCMLSNMTWLGEEPRCLGQCDNSVVITDESTGTRLVGGEFYGCVELYDDVTGQWGPVRGWRPYEGESHYEARMSWADLVCKNLGFMEGLATTGYGLSNGVVSNNYLRYLPGKYYQSYPSNAPKFIVSQSLPQWEGATLRDAIDHVVRGPCPSGHWNCTYSTMCLACAGERQHNDSHDIAAQSTTPSWTIQEVPTTAPSLTTPAVPTTTPLLPNPSTPATLPHTTSDPRPCGDFPWPDAAVEAVDCDYDYEYNGYRGQNVKGRCRVKCSGEDDLLVGPPAYLQFSPVGGDYVCMPSNMTWPGDEPRCLGQYNNSVVITDESNTTRLVGGESYGCVELYDNVTGQWGPVRGWDAREWGSHYEARMSWADLACRILGFREGLATAGYTLISGVARYLNYIPSHYRPSYPSSAPKFMVSQSLPQGEGAILHDAIDRVVRGACPSGDWRCSYDPLNMCLACAGERQHDNSNNIAAHVTCTSDHLEVSFPRPPDNSVQSADVQLAAPPCTAEGNSTHLFIRAPLRECGTSRESTPAEMIYRNTLIIGADSSHGGITWQPVTKVPLECRLPRNKTLSLDFRPHLESVIRSGVQGRGDFRISMELFLTDGFRQPVTEYPVFVELRQMIHVQIQVNSSDSDLQVFAHTCVATPSDDPDDTTRNDVIVDGCAKLPTLQFYPSSGPDRGRFGFQAFAYTSGVNMVYLHCNVLLCKASDPNSRCAQGCQTPSGRRRREAEGEPEMYRLIQGPMVVRGEDQNGEPGGTTATHGHQVTAAGAVVGACAVLAIAMSVGLLYKARRQGSQAGYSVLHNSY
ncbi:uncharacterized protein LOC144872021 [Branchiostoma floridae x Branchiostoma japonicum]